MKKAILAWSGGKDSAYALYKTLIDKKYKVVGLMTTINKTYGRISMHGIEENLLNIQTHSINLPLTKMYVSEGTYYEYESKMEEILINFKNQGIKHVIFGDIFLEDLRKYREEKLKKIGMTAIFPLWGIDTKKQINLFFEKQFKTKICSINDGYLTKKFVGKELNYDLIKAFPKNIDPCGENGEYHTFCYAGPIFKKNINIKVKEIIYRPLEIKSNEDCYLDKKTNTKGFWFAHIIPIIN